MKRALFLALVALCGARPLEEVALAFADFKATYNREYASAAVEAGAMKCFSESMDNIDRLNALDASATYGINKFADICASDFKQMYHNAVFTNKTSFPRAPAYTAEQLKQYQVADFDWRSRGVVNGVKDQAQCGSCWAFSAVATMEGAWKLAGHPLVSLSEEELVQCAKTAGNGCQGGEMSAAINWVAQHGGINSEGAYPYTSGRGVTGACNSARAGTSVAKFSGALGAPAGEGQLEAFLQQHGPLSIAVDAEDGWQSYHGGVKSVCGGRSLDHGVAIVGFGSGFWIVRNSWGLGWGEQGYIRLKQGVNCDGLAEQVCVARV